MAGDRELIDVIENDGLRRLYRYWQDKRAGRRYPSRSDIDPIDFAYVLGWIMLIDVSHDPLKFRFRLYGSELAGRLGVDMTGKYLDQHPQPEWRAYLGRSWADLVEKGEPTHGFFDRVIEQRKRSFESLRLPLSSDGATVDMLVIAVHARD
jgi:hypothetical protein